MTGLEVHPVLELPSAEKFRRLGPDYARRIVEDRARRMQLEKDDPLNFGYEAPIWHIVDDLLVDGRKVVLDLSRLEHIGVKPGGVDVPKEIEGRPEIYIAGSNRSSKSEYGAKKIMKILVERAQARTWSFADTGPISAARQQPIFAKYLPSNVKRMAAGTGKIRKGGILNVSYTQKGGFTEQTFVLENGSQHWFKNYEQHLTNVEGDQLDAIWLDELRNIELLRTLRGRVIDRAGLIIVTFTAIDDNYSAIVNEYERGARTILEVEAELLPIKRPKILSAGILPLSRSTTNLKESQTQHGRGSGVAGRSSETASGQTISAGNISEWANPKDPDEPGSPAENFLEVIGYEKVPRIKIAGPGTDGNQRANIVYFHITDNPYFGYDGAMQRRREGQAPLFGKDRYYRAYRNATRAKILCRVYGILSAGSAQQFPKFRDVIHVVPAERVPREGSNYHLVDPCSGRNWFMQWARIDPRGRWFIYREWPSHGHVGAYIPGIGDPGPWTLPGQPADGVRGPAQSPFGFGLERYRQEILRVEGHPEARAEIPAPAQEKPKDHPWWRSARAPRNPIAQISENGAPQTPETGTETILERWMDSRYGSSPTVTKEGSRTLIEQMSELDMEFLAASGKEIEEGTTLINDLLDYDEEVPLGEFSPRLARINEPRLFISENCPNTIYALREWTGKDKQHGACKDPIDLLRYAALAGLDYIGETAYAWQGGGTY
jgi:hypothetical protein